MSGKSTVEALNSLFEDAVKAGLPVRDEGKHLLVDPAPHISFQDIAESKLSDRAKTLIGAGFTSSGGLMQLKFIRHLPVKDDRGQITMELSGRTSRIGTEIVTQFGHDLEPTNLKFVPATKMLSYLLTYPNTKFIFDEFLKRPLDEQEANSLALVALARKAIGLAE